MRSGVNEMLIVRFLAASVVIGWLLPSGAATAMEKSFADFEQLQGLTRTTLTSAAGNRLDVIRYKSNRRLPAVVFIPGSLCAPAFASLDSLPGEAFTTVPMLSPAEREDMNAHVVYLERRNIVSLETLSAAPEFSIAQIFALSPCTDKNGAVTLEQRVDDVLTQIKWLRQQQWVDSVHLVGVSEGADVAAGVAAADGLAADSLMLVGGAGPSQFVDSAAFARRRGDMDDIRGVFSDLDEFLSSNAPKQYKGYSAKRWHSFAIANTPLDLLSASSVPLFIAHGSEDENVPVSSADLVAIELMRRQPERAILYWSVIGGDHMLKTRNGRRLGDLVVAYLAWARSEPSGRTFRAD